MPVRRGQDNKGSFYQNGKTGKKHYYIVGNATSRTKAQRQANGIRIVKHVRFSDKVEYFGGGGHVTDKKRNKRLRGGGLNDLMSQYPDLFSIVTPPSDDLTQWEPAPPGEKPGQERVVTLGKMAESGWKTLGDSFNSVFHIDKLPDYLDTSKAADTAGEAFDDVKNIGESLGNYNDVNKKLVSQYNKFVQNVIEWAKQAKGEIEHEVGKQRAQLTWNPNLYNKQTGQRGVSMVMDPKALKRLNDLDMKLLNDVDAVYATLLYNWTAAAGHRVSVVNGVY